MKKIVKEFLPYIIILITVILIRSFIATPVIVDGKSMNPNLKDNDILLLKKYEKKYKRFDIVAVKYNNQRLVKRIVGLPGDYVEYKNSKLYINGKETKEKFLTEKTKNFRLSLLGFNKIPEGYYFVMGDNRNESLDSRLIGLVSKKIILGKADFVMFPFNRFGKVK
jgi:signal peptidase I, bacterial type